MHLVIDVGNTVLKAAVFDPEELVEVTSFNVGVSSEASLPLKSLKKFAQNYDIKKAMMASVKGDIEELSTFLSGNYQFDLLTPRTSLPIKNEYKSPDTLGMDRLALAVGGNSFFPSHNVLVIDAGTCLTYDFINNNDIYLGGGISPGLKLRFQALHNFTTQLPLIDTKQLSSFSLQSEFQGDDFTGKDTAESIMKGTFYGALYEVEGMVDQYRSQFNDLKVVLTGGDAQFFERPLKSKIFVIPNLVLYGLNKILNYHEAKKEKKE